MRIHSNQAGSTEAPCGSAEGIFRIDCGIGKGGHTFSIGILEAF